MYAAKLKDGRTIPLYLTDVENEVASQEKLDSSYFDLGGEYNGQNISLCYDYGKNSIKSLKVSCINLEIKKSDIDEIIRSPFELKGRYALFMGSWYYPLGGIDDLVYLSDSIEDLEAIARDGAIFAMEFKNDWHQIVDMNTFSVVKKAG